MIIRRETLEDRAAVDAVTSAAFGRPGVDGEPVKTRLLRALRDDAGWISTLSMVAEHDDEIIGHVVCTRGRLGELDVLGLGPISVLPSRQRQGAGAALMHAVIGAADAADEPLIGLLGDGRRRVLIRSAIRRRLTAGTQSSRIWWCNGQSSARAIARGLRLPWGDPRARAMNCAPNGPQVGDGRLTVR